MAKYDIGDIVRVSASFFNISDALVDPTSASMIFQKPSGSDTTYVYGTDAELVKSTTGVYYADVTITEAGRWWVRWSSCGTGQATEETYFDVRSRTV